MARHRTKSSNPERSNAARERSLKALWAVRQGTSLSKAARDNGVTMRTVKAAPADAFAQPKMTDSFDICSLHLAGCHSGTVPIMPA